MKCRLKCCSEWLPLWEGAASPRLPSFFFFSPPSFLSLSSTCHLLFSLSLHPLSSVVDLDLVCMLVLVSLFSYFCCFLRPLNWSKLHPPVFHPRSGGNLRPFFCFRLSVFCFPVFFAPSFFSFDDTRLFW